MFYATICFSTILANNLSQYCSVKLFFVESATINWKIYTLIDLNQSIPFTKTKN